MSKRLVSKYIITCSVMLLTACNSGITKHDYDVDIATTQSQVSTWPELAKTNKVAYLNDVFHSPQVDELLNTAFANNPSFQQTLLTLDIRQAQLKQTRSEQLPQVDAGFSGSRKEGSDDAYTSSLSISWQADVWGKLKNATSAAQFDLVEQQALVNSARNALGADILNSWLGLIEQKRTIAIEQARLTSLSQTTRYTLERYRTGLAALVDLDSARTSLASTQVNLEVNLQSYQQNLRDLKTLIGQLSDMSLDVPDDYPDVALAAISLPDQTLYKRPDLQAAYAEIKASNLRTNVAYKDLLPNFKIEAMLENMASTPRDALFVSPLWSLLGQLTAPLYHGGELRAQAKVAELETAYAFQSYKNTLLNAVNEVETAIDQEQSLNKQLSQLNDALNIATNNLEHYQQRYRKGLVELLDLLTVQQQTYDLQLNVNQTTYQLLSNRITLALALALEIKQ